MDKNGKTILIAEDDFDFLEQLTLYLNNKGYNVISARDEKTARDMIEKEDFNLAILDLIMDNQDSGFVLGYQIKRKNKEIPVILVTSVTRDTGYRFDLADASSQAWIKADAVLNKNIRYEQLQREIDRLM